ncbi:hypothetical protein [Candidatus Magnetobacterium casense]|uniref:hypothetical protein n=1 Tax=Candidatus Magnetobacterium casense TaxID=1455061 RepID=UPI001C43BB05|nr:hypothetical protein [Candidatus Magnetobacterium casensis]
MAAQCKDLVAEAKVSGGTLSNYLDLMSHVRWHGGEVGKKLHPHRPFMCQCVQWDINH